VGDFAEVSAMLLQLLLVVHTIISASGSLACSLL
jgi:hypothetical protein